MRTQTFIVSMASALVFAGAAQATPTPFNFYTFDSFNVAQNTPSLPNSNGVYFSAGVEWASPSLSQPIFGASGTREAWAYNNGTGTPSASVGATTATFSTTNQGGAGLTYRGNAQDITNYIFSFNLNMSGAQSFLEVDFGSADGSYAQYIANYTTAGTHTITIDLSTLPLIEGEPGAFDFTAITDITIALSSGQAGGSATVSNFGYVPAPGAAALIGLAGLVATRRRRN